MVIFIVRIQKNIVKYDGPFISSRSSFLQIVPEHDFGQFTFLFTAFFAPFSACCSSDFLTTVLLEFLAVRSWLPHLPTKLFLQCVLSPSYPFEPISGHICCNILFQRGEYVQGTDRRISVWVRAGSSIAHEISCWFSRFWALCRSIAGKSQCLQEWFK